MKREIYTCDHCGKEINPMNDYTDFEFDNFNFVKEVDLCKKCFDELSDIVKKFISK